MGHSQLETSPLDVLRQLDTCAVANAIETFGVRCRNTGFTDSSVYCMYKELPPMVGYAATVRIRTCDPPMEGDRYYYRLDWLDHLLSIPQPRVLVLQDLDESPGLGAFIGDVHANILASLGCVGVVTNGAVRNLSQIRPLRFQMFAGNLSVSHAYAHFVDFGQPVEVGRMEVRPGDLLHGDLHGVQNIPLAIVRDVASEAVNMMEQERSIIDASRSPDFTVQKLHAEIKVLKEKRTQSER